MGILARPKGEASKHDRHVIRSKAQYMGNQIVMVGVSMHD